MHQSTSKYFDIIWNRDRLYEIMVFGTYRYVPVCTEYILVRNAENGTYHYVCTGMYSVCTGIMTCMIAMKSGTVLVFKHHHVPVLYTQYHFPLSKVKT